MSLQDVDRVADRLDQLVGLVLRLKHIVVKHAPVEKCFHLSQQHFRGGHDESGLAQAAVSALLFAAQLVA